MNGVFGWPPVVWSLRIALLVLVAGCTYLYLLLIAPFFRPANVRRMLAADIPRVRSLGAEFAGTRGEVEFAQDAKVTALTEGSDELARIAGKEASDESHE